MQAWREFWDGEHTIYAGERHRRAHDRLIARDLAALLPPGRPVLLDYGCGEAGHAAVLAPLCDRLLLCDSAPTVRDRLRARSTGMQAVTVLAPEDCARLETGSVDLAVMNSVVQYMSRDELAEALRAIRPVLGPQGRLVLGDVIPAASGALDDTFALLRFGREEGFLLPALAGLARTAASPYRRLRREVGLTRYAEDDMLALLRQTGFAARRLPRNIGHNQTRMAFEARPE
jgi:SAM-dependent methyltransferase